MAKDLTSFYEQVKQDGKLRTEMHAQRWTRATLQTLGLNLPRDAKKSMAKALPQELADYLTDVWWLFPFRNTNIQDVEFSERVARRAGNTDPRYAKLVAEAVFGAVRGMVGSDVARKVHEGLSPDLQKMWTRT